MSTEQREAQLGMQCPVCNVALVMTARQNIEIDYCPNCRGVWLDRGELDKIIERSTPETVPQQTAPTYSDQPRSGDYGDSGHGSRGHGKKHGSYGKHGSSGRHGGGLRGKASWLQELFD